MRKQNILLYPPELATQFISEFEQGPKGDRPLNPTNAPLGSGPSGSDTPKMYILESTLRGPRLTTYWTKTSFINKRSWQRSFTYPLPRINLLP